MYSLPYNPGVGFLNGLLPIAEVMNTVSPQTIGDDHPCPAIGTAHFTFCVVDQRSGTFAPAATPLIACPRNPGHVSSGRGPASAAMALSTRMAVDRFPSFHMSRFPNRFQGFRNLMA